MIKMKIDFNKLLSPENFDKFVAVNKKTNKEYLLSPKKDIAIHFNVSRPTLLKWMRENGYDHLIRKRKEKTEEDDFDSVDLEI